MSELDDIKARAAERRRVMPLNGVSMNEHGYQGQAEADLDRAIAMIQNNPLVEELAGQLLETLAERDKLIDERNEARTLAQSRYENLVEYAEQLEKARAAVLALRDAFKLCVAGDYQKVLADTESYEQHR